MTSRAPRTRAPKLIGTSAPSPAFAALALIVFFAGDAGAQSGCPAPAASFAFAGLHPAIEERMRLSHFRKGEIVEIDPRTMPEAEGRAYVRDLQALGARVSIYLVGGHCDIGTDCNALKGVKLGPTGSWNWDKSERRVIDITHPAVMDRLAKGIEAGWRLGANYVRVDNLHHPAGSTDPRTPDQLEAIVGLAHDIEDRLRRSGTIPPDRVTGVVAHNNLVVWETLINAGQIRRPPAFLTSERTAQLFPGRGYEGDARMKAGTLKPDDIPEILAGGRIAAKLRVPYSVVEFRRTHDLAARDKTYALPQAYVDRLRAMPGVSEVIVMPSETHYVGRGEVYPGPGPKLLPAAPQCPPV